MKKYFFTGLVTLLPLAVTIWVVHFMVDLLTKPFIGLVLLLTDRLPIESPPSDPNSEPNLYPYRPLLAYFIDGALSKKVLFFKHVLRLGDRILEKIPLVNKVYKTTKDIVNSLFGLNQNSFKQVVLLQFPYPGSYSLGLIARVAPKTCSEAEKGELLTIYIPTTPNPSTGYLVMSQKKDLIYLDMRAQDAIKYVVSCGVIQPEELQP